MKELNIASKCVVWSGAFVVILPFAADFLLLFLGCWHEAGGLSSFFVICFWCLVGAMRSMS